MKKLLILGFAVAMFSCATEGKLREQLDTWVGVDVNSLIARMGPPDSTYEMPNKVRLFSWNNLAGYLSTASYNPYTRTSFSVGSEVSCKVTFSVVPDGKITGYQYKGNNCKSKEGDPDIHTARKQSESHSADVLTVKADAVQQATDECARAGKKYRELNSDLSPGNFFQYPIVELRYKCENTIARGPLPASGDAISANPAAAITVGEPKP